MRRDPSAPRRGRRAARFILFAVSNPMLKFSSPLRHVGAALSIAAAVGLAACGPRGANLEPLTAAPATSARAGVANPEPLPQGGMPAPRVDRAPASPPVAPMDYPEPPVAAAAPVPAPTVAPAAPVPAPPMAARPAPAPRAVAKAAPSATRGEVVAIEPIRERPEGTGKGAVIGGLLGGVVGNQFGHGKGRAAMTIVGAAGGAVAGNNVERNVSKRVVGYRVSVRLDNGRSRTYQEPSLNGLQVGDRVRVDGGRLRRG